MYSRKKKKKKTAYTMRACEFVNLQNHKLFPNESLCLLLQKIYKLIIIVATNMNSLGETTISSFLFVLD